MLSDQRSPYVGRFARGWRRLPGRFPGQPQTRTRARPSIGSRVPPGERPSGREKMDLLGPNTPKRLGAGSRGCPGREHVVNQQDPGWGEVAAGLESALHGSAALVGRAPSLGSCRANSRQQRRCRPVQSERGGLGESSCLVETALGQPPAGKGNPCDRIDRGSRSGRQHRVGQDVCDAAPPRELEPQDRRPCGPFKDERGPRGRDLGRRTVGAGRLRWRRGCRASATLAPGRQDRDQSLEASVAERPRPARATCAARREQGIHDPTHRAHPRRLVGPTDTPARWF